MNSITTTEHATTELGSIQIAPEVLEVIAGLATVEIDGVAGMSGGLAGGIAEMLGRKNLSKGVKVAVQAGEAVVDVSVVVEYGFRIPDVCEQIGRNVKNAVQSMTGIQVTEVNIHIHDVQFKTQEKAADNDASSSRVK